LNLVYVHYHLKPGGVTTVLRHQVQSLPSGTPALVLSGEPPSTAFPAPVAVIEGLGYDGTPGTEKQPVAVAQSIAQTIDRHFNGSEKDTLLHIHNPTLAKNTKFLDIIRHLQKMGYPLLLQIHDFAEDGRPSAYFRDADYPADCHYCVINQRDYGLLAASGLVSEGLHYLPNCVPNDQEHGQGDDQRNFVLYPVRAIRRKNIGEALLLSLFLPADCQIYITLPPNSPADFPSYRFWQHLTQDRRLPIRFEMGLRKNFQDLLRQARHVVSTSIAEGFGFTFLEPWVAGKNLEGRLLPAICNDFSDADIRMGHLYTRVDIPLAWFGRKRLIERFQDCYRRNRRLFGHAAEMPSTQSFTAPLLKAEFIDFGLLDEPLQALVIKAVQSDPARRQRLLALNPALQRMGRHPRSHPRIQHNRDRIIETYGQITYGSRLKTIYREAVTLPVCHRIDKSRLVKEFMQFHNFNLLKWNAYRAAL
jgi:hypothetical protein